MQARRPIAGQTLRGTPASLAHVQALFHQGKIGDADEAIDALGSSAMRDPQCALLRGLVDQRLGRADRAIAALTPVAQSKSPYALEATVALAETLYFAHHREALADLVDRSALLAVDSRGALMRARIESWADAAAAAEALTKISRGAGPGGGVVLKRVAGFEAVQLLDRLGRYREAFDFATELHRETTPPYDLEGLVGGIRRQVELLARSGGWGTPKQDPVDGVVLVVGLPRSGTTLLEQMLDGHPEISGIGEYDGVERLAEGVASLGVPLGAHGQLPREALRELRDRYVAGARRLARVGARWTFDKTLCVWRVLPEVCAVLPGAKMVHIARDPRDNAISAFLSFFNPMHYGWMSSLGSIRSVIEAERLLLPDALARLGVDHEAIVYERLVADPANHAMKVLALLGLDAHDAVLAPERNSRTVFTLSHEQVTKPINSGSIGRWRNYEWAFDSKWDALAERHETARTVRTA